LRAQTSFGRYRGRRIPFSYFALPDSFSVVPRASGLVFIFCALILVFSGTEGVGSHFHFLRPDSCSAVPRASSPIFIFCAPDLVFGGTEGVESRFHILRSRTRFRRYRGRRVPFSYFTRPDLFSTVLRATCPIFMFSAPDLIFGGTEGVGVLFSYFALSYSFSAVPSESGPFSCFALPDSFSVVPRASNLVFMFSAPVHVFGGVEGVGSRFHVLCSRTRFRRYRGRRVPSSCFARPDSFSAEPRALAPVFMFCVSGLVFDSTEGSGSRFHILRT
jgi:hypothetical protein